MDITGLSNLGVAGALVLVVGYLLTANHRMLTANRTDRAAYLRALATREAEHSAAVASLRTAHAAELSLLRTRLAGLERRLAEVEGELDAERRRRRAAEDRAAQVRRSS